jgi:hypothetical protein
MGRSIERQDGEDFKRSLPGHFQDELTTDAPTDRQRNRVYQQRISKVFQRTRRALRYHVKRGDQSQYR